MAFPGGQQQNSNYTTGPPLSAGPNRTVFLRPIPADVKEAALTSLFEKNAGPVQTVKITAKGYA
tara:strand:- start:59 stop:250 length:192 start_codon:yes stop_codon:yes gene_type:complete